MDDLTPAYDGLMFWYRHELRRLRASRRAGFHTRSERRGIIKEMLALRRKRPAHKTIAWDNLNL